MSMSQERPEVKPGSQVVHMRENSDTELEALFQFALNPDGKSKPLRERNLPRSFFQQPEPPKIHHSKEGSADSTGYNPTNTGAPSIAHIRAHSSPPSLQQTLSAAPPPPPQHVRGGSYDLTDEQPLPPGWDMAKTPHGQRYFLNHLAGTTTWQDPRKTQSTTSLNSNQSLSPNPTQAVVNVEKVPLPAGWERAYTLEGEVYFINHLERTTSWFHPAIPQQMQRPGMRLQQMQQAQLGNQSSQVAAGSGQRPLTPAERQRQIQLKQLALEKERLKKRQDEIARQEMIIRATLGPSNTSNESDSQVVIPQNNEMTTVTDPFLGQTGTTDLHTRQESTDSGLGGMGTSYSLPRTPEDFLSNMEDMDTQDGGHKLQGQSDFGSMDISTGGNSESCDPQMVEEELVASLQEDISCDLLRDVENVLNSNKMDNLLTWL